MFWFKIFKQDTVIEVLGPVTYIETVGQWKRHINQLKDWLVATIQYLPLRVKVSLNNTPNLTLDTAEEVEYDTEDTGTPENDIRRFLTAEESSMQTTQISISDSLA